MTAPRGFRVPVGPVLVLTTLVASVISSFGAPLIPEIARRFQVPASTAQWSLTVALLAGTASSPVLGRLGDGRRSRTALLSALLAVTAGAVVAALADDFALLLLGRALQGVGLGLAPLAMAIARAALPRPRAAPTIALLSVSSAAGLGAGYPISGWLADTWGLPGAYGFGALVSALALLCAAIAVPRGSDRGASARFDGIGLVLLVVALVAVLVAVAQGAQWGWGSAPVIGLLSAGAVLLALWTAQQSRAASPLVRLRLLRVPAVLSGDVCALVLGVAMYMALSAVTQFVQSPWEEGFGFSASGAVAGLVLVPLSVVMFCSSRALPALTARLGTGAVLALGALVAAAGCGFFAILHTALWQAFVMAGVLGAGLGITFAAIPGVIADAVPAGETGSAIGFSQVLRFTGYAAGSALTASILDALADVPGHPTEAGYAVVLWSAAGICVLAAAAVRCARPGSELSSARRPSSA